MNNKIRVFPTITISDGNLVKTTKFKNSRYLGDPINAIKLFNNKSIDEICILDMSNNHSKKNHSINTKLLSEMATEAFIPLSYGGNVLTINDARLIISIGFEKVIVNSLFHNDLPELIKISEELGSQSVVLKIDYIFYKNNFHFFSQGKILDKIINNKLIERINQSKVGELILSRVDYDGMMQGYDLNEFTSFILTNTNIPVVLSNGAKNKNSILEASKKGFKNFTAGSAYVFVGELKGILINNPF
jgi:imidazole glycerol-phosphate synthase subunit HisF